ncbi:DUF2087 domain-containing protein [Cryptosporangium phraense]|uniref:DUF2087 domain-containing protein n=1 Tax=Cryptosporangium phraense TaxID=2593070 RepID=A0A545ATM3_9ACTN|nr:DUF2087 domain-containing protein [Cryptosporangium phraense]TQS44676.1 DUF2087 domain-containing protein [Cryptosporangium phraense]
MDSDLTPDAVVRLLAEPVRLRVFAALTLGVQAPGSRTPAALAELTGDSPRAVNAALTRLRAGGLVEPDGPAFAARTDVFRDLARRAAPEATGAGTDAVLRPFVRGDRLIGFPAAWTKKRLVLEYLAGRSFPWGEEVGEAAVNERLAAWCEGAPIDHVSVRRYLVDAGILTREAGVYRRAEPAPV